MNAKTTCYKCDGDPPLFLMDDGVKSLWICRNCMDAIINGREDSLQETL